MSRGRGKGSGRSWAGKRVGRGYPGGIRKNQKAHEVTRDVTAWAGWVIVSPEGVTRPVSGIGPILLASRSRAWARLGPLSVKFVLRRASHRRFGADGSLGVAHPTGWRGGFPTGRPWDFAFGSTPVAIVTVERCRSTIRRPVPQPARPVRGSKPRLPDPFLGSFALPRPLPGGSCELGPTLRVSGNSLPAVRTATCGDVNPTCLMRRSRAH